MQLYGFIYSSLIQLIFQQIYLVQTVTTTPSQSGPGNYGNERVIPNSPEFKPHHQV